MTRALVLDEWQLRNTSDKPVTVSVKPGRVEKTEGETVVMVWKSQAVEDTTVEPGGVLSFPASVQAHLTDEPDLVEEVSAERAARKAVIDAAWNGPGRLETPDRDTRHRLCPAEIPCAGMSNRDLQGSHHPQRQPDLFAGHLGQ